MKILYIGQRVRDGKVVEVFSVLNDDYSEKNAITFKPSKNLKGYRVGHVYEIDEPDGSTYKFGTTEWDCEHPDKDFVKKLQAEYQAARMEKEAMAVEKRMATNDSGLKDHLDALRVAYQGLHFRQRPAFEVWVLNQLRKGS
jgi:hypothetical protein